MLNFIRVSFLVIIAFAFGSSFFLYQQTLADGGRSAPAGAVMCTPPPPGMVAWWDGEGSGRDIRGENDGTPNNGVTFPAGEVGQAFGLNGSNQFVEVPSNPAVRITGAISIDAWINPSTTAPLTQEILSKYDSPQSQLSYSFSLRSGGALRFAVYQTGDASIPRYVDTTSGLVTTGTFTHVAATFDPATQVMKIYVNGGDTNASLGAGSTNVTSIFDSTTPVRIGAVVNSGSGATPFSGMIDEVEIFNRALTQPEVQAIVNAGSAGKCRPRCTPPPSSGMVSWWDGDDNPFDRQGTNHGVMPPTGAGFGTGKVGRSFTFDGSQNPVAVPDNASLDAQTLTIDAWIFPTTLDGAEDIIVNKEVIGTVQYEMAVKGSLSSGGSIPFGHLTVFVGGISGLPNEDGGWVDGGGPLPLNTWSHVAMTFDGSTLNAFINGVLTRQVTGLSGTVASSNGPFRIGARNPNAGFQTDPFNGSIDEVEVFDRALLDTEIRQINNAGFAGKCKLCLTPPNNMIGWWAGDGDDRDVSGAGNDGTSEGAVAFGVGKVGQAFKFNGTDSAVVAAPASVAVMNQLPLTVDAWVRPALREGDSVDDLFPNNAVSNDVPGEAGHGFGVNVMPDGSKMTVEYQNGFEIIDYPFIADEWYHIATVYTEGNVKSYVDGILVDDLNFEQGALDSTAPVSIGKHNDDAETYGNRRFFKGLIDEVEIFNRALDQTEIQSIVAAGASGKCKLGCTPPPPSMISWWDGSGSGSVVNDIQGPNVGSLQAGAVFTTAKVGQGFGLNGTTAYVNIPDDPNLYPAGSFTTDAWIKTNQNKGIEQIITHYECSGNCPGNSANSIYDLYINGDKLEAEIRDTTGADQILIGTHTVTDGKFHHVALQRNMESDPQLMVLYLDGAIEASASLIPTAVLKDDDNTPDPITIGAIIQNNNPGCGCPLQLFAGVIDEVEYFDRALSQSEVQAIFNAGSAGKCKSGSTPNQRPEGLGSIPIVHAGDATITFPNGAGAGNTIYQTLPTYQPGPMNFGVSNPLHVADISTNVPFQGLTRVCFNLQAGEFAAAPFTQLRVFHLEGNLLVNRTTFANSGTHTLCADVGSFSQFVIAKDVNVPTAAPANISGQITTPDGSPLAGVTMKLSGTSSARTITDANGDYYFPNVETDGFYTVTPARLNYQFSPADRSFSLLGDKTDAVFTAIPDAVIVGNPLETPEYFVRQHYVDFLNREPDDAGFNFWSDQIASCGADAGCLEVKRVNVSAAYFLSIEFQETGGLVDGLYRASYGRRPQYAEFLPDTRTLGQNVVVGRSGWEAQLAANKAAFMDAFVGRSDFPAAYDNLNNGAYVDTLIAHTGVSYSQAERDALVSSLSNGNSTRARVLQTIAENDRFVRSKFNEAFVMMEYFGYLRRDPDESGYQFWLTKLNQFNGNFVQAEMVKAFITSSEYRQRFER